MKLVITHFSTQLVIRPWRLVATVSWRTFREGAVIINLWIYLIFTLLYLILVVLLGIMAVTNALEFRRLGRLRVMVVGCTPLPMG